MKDNIILIGMPGVGKSTVGVVLAKVMGLHFLDSDLLIQEKTGRLLRNIIEEDGIDGFIRTEEEVNASISVRRTVIATGGSVVYGAKAMEHFRELGTIIYLKLGCKALRRRLGNLEKRGVVVKQGQSFADLYRERVPLYEKYADITVDTAGRTIEDAVRLIVESL